MDSENLRRLRDTDWRGRGSMRRKTHASRNDLNKARIPELAEERSAVSVPGEARRASPTANPHRGGARENRKRS